MNERIRQLAAPHMMHERFSRYGESTEEDYYEFYPDELEEFVKTIVQECARIARANLCPYEDEETLKIFGHTWDIASVEAGRKIVKHFGVE